MTGTIIHQPIISKKSGARRCLSCGASENMGRRKYCSMECRQRLHGALNRRTGLLRALQVRYATFYFTDYMVIMDVLPYGNPEIFSFVLPRAYGRKPVSDFCLLSELLGNAWWAEQRRTSKRYMASRHILSKAIKSTMDCDAVIPPQTAVPSVKGASMINLKLGRMPLESDRLREEIKNAFRRQAKKHHPDLGGDSTMFRKIHEAYQSLLDWAEHPTFITRRGFPDKWFYDGNINKWVNPAPHLKMSTSTRWSSGLRADP